MRLGLLLLGAGGAVVVVAAAAGKKRREFDGVFAGAASAEQPPTLAMMRAATPPAPAAPPEWNRVVASGISAGRSKLCNPNTGNCFGVPPSEVGGRPQLDLARGGSVFVRLWAESRFSPVRDKTAVAAGYWAWVGNVQPGKVLTNVANRLPVQGTDWPAMTWIAASARVMVTGELQVIFYYPGNEHTGKERGRDYDVVVEWRQTST